MLQKSMLLGGLKLSALSRWKGLWWGKKGSKGLVFLLVSLLVLSGVGGFLGLLTAQTGDVTVNLTVEPLLDMYGMPAMNEDGTFYPCDKFELTYRVELASGVSSFDEVKISYDPSVFNMFSNSSDFGAVGVGGGDFEVLPSASEGVYFFSVEVWVNSSSSFNDGSGTERFVLAEATLNIEVVKYDPHFVLNLAYTMPLVNNSCSDESSFDKPFALILCYEGNGQDFNLRQRAVVDDYFWEGYAQKVPELDAMQQMLTPDITVADFFSQTSNVQFLAQGIVDNEVMVSESIVSVDGVSFASGELPKTFFWEANSNHTYAWTPTLSGESGNMGGLAGLSAEWFEWQLCIVFPPSLSSSQMDFSQTDQTLIQAALQNQLSEQFNSRNGTLTVNQFGNTLTALYAYNKLFEKFADEVGVEKNQTLQCLTPMPIYFNAQERYAKIQYRLNPTVAKEVIAQNFTNALYYNVSLGCNLFGQPVYFEANFTAPYEFFDKLFNATAYTWDSSLQSWGIDPAVSIEARFGSAFNFTETDVMLWSLEEQTSDQNALSLALDDFYDCGLQVFTGRGVVEANLRRTSPLYYSLEVEAGKQGQQQKVFLERTVQISFRDNKPYTLPLNFDSSSPLQVSVISEGAQSALLSLDAPMQLGGLTNVTVYLITNVPSERNLNELAKHQFDLKVLKTLNLTMPQEQIQAPIDYEHNAQQFYQYYTGYSSVYADVLGFCGQTQIAIQKNQDVIALTSQGQALLYVEAVNVWGTTFHQVVPIEPYSKPYWNIPLNEVTIFLVILVVVAILAGFLVYFIKAK